MIPALLILSIFEFTPLGLHAATGPTATLALEAYGPDGRIMSVNDFAQMTSHTMLSKWTMSLNYGVFAMGALPAARQLGPMFPAPDRQYLAFSVPANQSVYFTSLWKADGIGTVYMRADNAGRGYTVAEGASQVLQLPYEFVLSEYAVVSRIAASNPAAITPSSSRVLDQVAALVRTATSAAAGGPRAAASYQALAVVMTLKEQLAIEVANAAISRTGYRNEFVWNYEGFSSWTDQRFVPLYAQTKAAGFSTVLTACDWNVISPSRGVYNFSSLDFQVDRPPGARVRRRL